MTNQNNATIKTSFTTTQPRKTDVERMRKSLPEGYEHYGGRSNTAMVNEIVRRLQRGEYDGKIEPEDKTKATLNVDRDLYQALVDKAKELGYSTKKEMLEDAIRFESKMTRETKRAFGRYYKLPSGEVVVLSDIETLQYPDAVPAGEEEIEKYKKSRKGKA